MQFALQGEAELASSESYYYDTDGSRVPLKPTDQVAVDLEVARSIDIPSHIYRSLSTQGRELRGGVTMIERAQLPPELQSALDHAGALHPVFSAQDGATLVVLPEVRIEVADEEQGNRLESYLQSVDADALVERKAKRLTVKPGSASGRDALSLANRIEEELHPPVAQARFLRILPRPKAS